MRAITVSKWFAELRSCFLYCTAFRGLLLFAYAEEHVRFVDAADVKSGKVAASAIPKVSDEYAREAHHIARRRLALAAHRLAEVLKPVW